MAESIEENHDQAVLEISGKFLEEIRNGDVDHGLSVAQMMLSEGPDFEPELLIVLIESVAELCAQAGSENAREYLSDSWPTLRRAHMRRLTRNQGLSDAAG